VPNAADVQHHPVLGVYVQYVHHSASAAGASRRLRLVTTYHVNLNRTKAQATVTVSDRAPITAVGACPTNLNMASARLQINLDGLRPSTISPAICSSAPFWNKQMRQQSNLIFLAIVSFVNGGFFIPVSVTYRQTTGLFLRIKHAFK
jgi:hypothetical protein